MFECSKHFDTSPSDTLMHREGWEGQIPLHKEIAQGHVKGNNNNEFINRRCSEMRITSWY